MAHFAVPWHTSQYRDTLRSSMTLRSSITHFVVTTFFFLAELEVLTEVFVICVLTSHHARNVLADLNLMLHS